MPSPLAKKNLGRQPQEGSWGMAEHLCSPMALVNRNHGFLVAEAGGDRVGCEKWVLHVRGCANRHYLL